MTEELKSFHDMVSLYDNKVAQAEEQVKKEKQKRQDYIHAATELLNADIPRFFPDAPASGDILVNDNPEIKTELTVLGIWIAYNQLFEEFQTNLQVSDESGGTYYAAFQQMNFHKK